MKNYLNEMINLKEQKDTIIVNAAACAGYEKCIVKNVITGQDITWMNWKDGN